MVHLILSIRAVFRTLGTLRKIPVMMHTWKLATNTFKEREKLPLCSLSWAWHHGRGMISWPAAPSQSQLILSGTPCTSLVPYTLLHVNSRGFQTDPSLRDSNKTKLRPLPELNHLEHSDVMRSLRLLHTASYRASTLGDMVYDPADTVTARDYKHLYHISDITSDIKEGVFQNFANGEAAHNETAIL